MYHKPFWDIPFDRNLLQIFLSPSHSMTCASLSADASHPDKWSNSCSSSSNLDSIFNPPTEANKSPGRSPSRTDCGIKFRPLIVDDKKNLRQLNGGVRSFFSFFWRLTVKLVKGNCVCVRERAYILLRSKTSSVLIRSSGLVRGSWVSGSPCSCSDSDRSMKKTRIACRSKTGRHFIKRKK